MDGGEVEMRCRKCESRTCRKCKEKMHLGVCRNKADEAMKALAEVEGWTWCKRCGRCVELLGGCNHMTCRYTAYISQWWGRSMVDSDKRMGEDATSSSATSAASSGGRASARARRPVSAFWACVWPSARPCGKSRGKRQQTHSIRRVVVQL